MCGKGSEDIRKPFWVPWPPWGYGSQEAEVTGQEISQGEGRVQQIWEMTSVPDFPIAIPLYETGKHT